MILTLWLPLANRPADWMLSASDLWTKQIDTGTVPTTYDRVVLWPDEGVNPTMGPMWSVRRRYLAADGGWHVELSQMAVDPDDRNRDEIMRYHSAGGLGSGPKWSIWWTERDGDPVPHLREGGWKLYGEETSRG